MRIHHLAIDEALASLHSSRAGLTHEEAERRLHEFGPNRVQSIARPGRVVALLKEFTQFFSLVLWSAAALAFLVEFVAPGQGMDRLAYSIVAVILVSGFFSYWQEFRAERTLAALTRLLPSRVRVLRAGKAYDRPAADLVPGDVVLLTQGDNVPADCRAIEAYSARINMATVTGESLPQPCDANPSSEETLTRARNVLLAGTTLVSGTVSAVVFATGMRTEFGLISALAQESGKAVSPLRRQIAHLSRIIATLALAIGVLFFAAGWHIGIPLWIDFTFAIGIIVAMVPEGLLPTLTLALVLASQRMARRHVLIRHLLAVEALGSTTVICTDKTGTLTQNRMRVKALFLGTHLEADAVAGCGAAFVATHRPFFLAAALCHDLAESERDGTSTLLGDPMEVALVEVGRRNLTGEIHWRRLHEIPFDAQRMRLSTVHASPQGRVLYCKGALETVLPHCTRALEQGEARPFTDTQREAIIRAHAQMAERGLRVLAFAFRAVEETDFEGVDLERELVFCGLAGLEDPPRAEVAGALRTCREAGVGVIMVTGDHPVTALAIAREIGLAPPRGGVVLTGDELRRLSDTRLQLALDTPDILFARVSSDQKRRIVEALKLKGHIVAVTGDGVNDAPALKSAHIGIAMGIAGTDVAREAADVVLLDDNFVSIVNGIEEGRAVFDNIRKFLTYILAHNVPELAPYLTHALLPVPLALTPIQILAIDMGTDSLTALALGIEKPDPRAMRRPPRPQTERLLDWRLALRAYFFLGLIESMAAMFVFFIVLLAAGWSYGERFASSAAYLQATTACLIAIVVMQAANVFLCRSADRSLFVTGVRGNPLILCGVALAIALAAAIAYTPILSGFFGTAPVGVDVWLMALPCALAMVVFEESRKALVRFLRTRYSCRNASIGSSRAARLAGK